MITYTNHKFNSDLSCCYNFIYIEIKLKLSFLWHNDL